MAPNSDDRMDSAEADRWQAITRRDRCRRPNVAPGPIPLLRCGPRMPSDSRHCRDRHGLIWQSMGIYILTGEISCGQASKLRCCIMKRIDRGQVSVIDETGTMLDMWTG